MLRQPELRGPVFVAVTFVVLLGLSRLVLPLTQATLAKKSPDPKVAFRDNASPEQPAGSFSPAAAARGNALFSGKAKCSTCHVEGVYSEPGWNLHTGADVCIDDFQADRSPDHRYRTSPLAGLWTHQKGGFFHDGRFATLLDVVNHYDQSFTLGLTDPERSDLVEYLKSLPD